MSIKDCRILVTGPAGQIAFPLAARLARPGDLDRLLQEPRETLLAIGRGLRQGCVTLQAEVPPASKPPMNSAESGPSKKNRP